MVTNSEDLSRLKAADLIDQYAKPLQAGALDGFVFDSSNPELKLPPKTVLGKHGVAEVRKVLARLIVFRAEQRAEVRQFCQRGCLRGWLLKTLFPRLIHRFQCLKIMIILLYTL